MAELVPNILIDVAYTLGYFYLIPVEIVNFSG